MINTTEKISTIKNLNFNLISNRRKKNINLREANEIQAFHNTLDNKVTPLIKLSSLAHYLGVNKIFLKDESQRFGLNSFKALGSSYAIYKNIKQYPEIKILCTATDGNHGRSVAWMAKKLGRKAVIFIPDGTAIKRIRVIEEEGAEVIAVKDNYDTAVKMAYKYVNDNNHKSKKQIYSLIQDTSWKNYHKIPADIMKGYWTQMVEVTKQIRKEKIDFVFLQVGVGSWAASVIDFISIHWKNYPLFISVEPNSANCLFQSLYKGEMVTVNSEKTTSMTGLNCQSISNIAWPILKKGIFGCMSISDEITEEAMRILAQPFSGDPCIISGESGASGLGAMIALMTDERCQKFQNSISINEHSNILVINTEGDTDPINYRNIVSQSKKITL